MRYFRTYPWGMQLLLLLITVLMMMLFVSSLAYLLLPRLTGYDISQLVKINEHSDYRLISTAISIQGLGSLFTYVLGSILFACLAHPKPEKYLGLKRPQKIMLLPLSVLVMVSLTPLLIWIGNMIGKINFGASVKAQQQMSDDITRAFLVMPGFLFFVKCFVVIAVIPALGEELFFRGLLLRFAKKRTRTMVIPIIFTAVVFAYSHTNIYGYASIFIAGVVLAGIYYLTGSLWCSIAAHMSFNGLQVILAYISSNSARGKNVADETMPAYVVIAGLALFVFSFYLLLKNRTPLPADWTNDFDTPGEAEGSNLP